MNCIRLNVLRLKGISRVSAKVLIRYLISDKKGAFENYD